ncbi:MAG TPA: hypothetical protein VFP54_09750 [Acidimicrobiales bacterium]|nr:hypothetical protein [Acidimicrobiales bacterium]
MIALVLALVGCGSSITKGLTPVTETSHMTSPATEATKMCSSAFGSHYVNSAIGTVGDVRTLEVGPGLQPGESAYVGLPASQVSAWCWTGTPGDYTLYAVVGGRPPLKIEGMAVSQAPAPGPAPIP